MKFRMLLNCMGRGRMADHLVSVEIAQKVIHRPRERRRHFTAPRFCAVVLARFVSNITCNPAAVASQNVGARLI